MTVRLEVPEATPLTVDVLDVLGRRVAVLLDGEVEAGRHTVRWEARDLPAGVYVIRLQTDGTVATHRVTLLR